MTNALHKRARVLQVRMTDEERAKLVRLAERARRSLSDYVRIELLKIAKKDLDM